MEPVLHNHRLLFRRRRHHHHLLLFLQLRSLCP